MPHVLEYATSGRAKCRGCDTKLEKGELRFGERRPNTFGDGEMTLWFHVICAAFRRPEPFIEYLDSDEAPDVSADDLVHTRGLRPAAEQGLKHHRLPRLQLVSRAPTGRARCRHCRELIEKDAWRIGLSFFEEHRFNPSGFIHAGCAHAYFETREIMDRIVHFNEPLTPEELDTVSQLL